MKYSYLLFLLFFFLLRSPGEAQEILPDQLLQAVKKKLSMIRDFTADAEIIVEVDLIKIPDKYAKVFFKFPDKFKFKSQGFILVPKKGMVVSLYEMFEQPYTSVYGGSVVIDDKTYEGIKLIPLDSKNDLVLANILIDPATAYIRRIESNTRTSGSYTIDMAYDPGIYPLPYESIITFEVDKMKLPMKFISDMQWPASGDTSEPEEARVIIRYSNYKVNVGVADSLFSEGPENGN